MSFEVFRDNIVSLARKAGETHRIKYKNDTENGLYIATFSDNTKIIGRPNSLQLTVRWGSGHMATAVMNA